MRTGWLIYHGICIHIAFDVTNVERSPLVWINSCMSAHVKSDEMLYGVANHRLAVFHDWLGT